MLAIRYTKLVAGRFLNKDNKSRNRKLMYGSRSTEIRDQKRISIQFPYVFMECTYQTYQQTQTTDI